MDLLIHKKKATRKQSITFSLTTSRDSLWATQHAQWMKSKQSLDMTSFISFPINWKTA